ncbi:MAG: hypothetical protein ACKORB_04135 [Opitutia bacterium]
MQEPSSYETKSFLTAAVASVTLHAVLLLVLPSDFSRGLAVPAASLRPTQVVVAPTEVSPARLPEHMRPRFIEAPAAVRKDLVS